MSIQGKIAYALIVLQFVLFNQVAVRGDEDVISFETVNGDNGDVDNLQKSGLQSVPGVPLEEVPGLLNPQPLISVYSPEPLFKQGVGDPAYGVRSYENDGPREIYHKGERGVLCRGIFISWHTIGAAVSSVNSRYYAAKVRGLRRQMRSPTVGKRQPLVALLPVGSVAGKVVIEVGVAGTITLGVRIYDHYQKRKIQRMLMNPIPPSDSNKSREQTVMDRSKWFEFQSKYNPQNVKYFKADYVLNDRHYEKYRQHHLMTFFLPGGILPYPLPRLVEPLIIEKKIEKKPLKPKQKTTESSTARHNREHFNNRLPAINENRKKGGLPPLKPVNKGEKPPVLRPINGIEHRVDLQRKVVE